MEYAQIGFLGHRVPLTASGTSLAYHTILEDSPSEGCMGGTGSAMQGKRSTRLKGSPDANGGTGARSPLVKLTGALGLQRTVDYMD